MSSQQGPSAAPPPAGSPEPGFDLVLAQLRGLVEKLEGGQLSLEQSLATFEEAVRLSRMGALLLDAAESRIEILLKPPGASSDETKPVPFEPGAR